MSNMKRILCLLLLMGVIEATWSRGKRHGFGKNIVRTVVKHIVRPPVIVRKPQNQQCLGLCQTNSQLRAKLVAKICPDPCEGIDCNGRGVCSGGRCTCETGFSGCDCEVVDPCFNITCQNGGTCKEGVCTCTDNFNGTFCEIDLCDCVDCNDRGNCVAGICMCQEGFIGNACETIDRCVNVTCGENGTCNDGNCQCDDGFSGDRCEIIPRIDPCENVVCGVNGTCDNGTCLCDTGFFGNMCQINGSCEQMNDMVTVVNEASQDNVIQPGISGVTLMECEVICITNPECFLYIFGSTEPRRSRCLQFSAGLDVISLSDRPGRITGACTFLT